jgi:hypothetical protein
MTAFPNLHDNLSISNPDGDDQRELLALLPQPRCGWRLAADVFATGRRSLPERDAGIAARRPFAALGEAPAIDLGQTGGCCRAGALAERGCVAASWLNHRF